ncbi:MAG: DUF429 domain-containing protein, partial [Chloroflexi bacterium]|nr:DUF429 domain-containing protein [Chloroflexota bacterium]
IGLPEYGPRARTCDQEARRLLGPKRAASIFPVPCRPALYAACYTEANEINKHIMGKQLSIQTWGIARKMREVDRFLARKEEVRSRNATLPQTRSSKVLWPPTAGPGSAKTTSLMRWSLLEQAKKKI